MYTRSDNMAEEPQQQEVRCPLSIDGEHLYNLLLKNEETSSKLLDLLTEDKKENQEKEKTKRMVLITTVVSLIGLIAVMVWAYFTSAYNDNFSVDMKIDNKSKREIQQNYRR